jgi:UDP-N-acetylglucosamine 2-epimerase (non-hydrolysing)
MRKWCICVGARPNFVKLSPLLRAIEAHNDSRPTVHDEITYQVVHTGQHYDIEMSSKFFQDLKMPAPDVSLGIGSGTHGYQTGLAMIKFEKVLLANSFDLVVVFGDVNSTLACAIVASKLNIPLAHIEAGCRSGDWAMPEEINRSIIDLISDYLFCATVDDVKNLSYRAVSLRGTWDYVGNIMVDTVMQSLPIAAQVYGKQKHDYSQYDYGIVTLHRPSNVDSIRRFYDIMIELNKIARTIPLFFSVHPRLTKKLPMDIVLSNCDNITFVSPPPGYLEFLWMLRHAQFVITDSGGVQVEATVLNTPCFTLRDTTEWPITVSMGTNTLVDVRDLSNVVKTERKYRTVNIPKWDGQTAKRIVERLMQR